MLAQGSQAHAKEDTALLVLDGDIVTDLSQIGVDLTASGGGSYELNSARTALSTRWNIAVIHTFTGAENTVVLLWHGLTAATHSYMIRTDAAGKLLFRTNAVTRYTSAAAMQAHEYLIAWSNRPNPDTTGASDAQISEFLIYDITAGQITDLAQSTHPTTTTSSTYELGIGGVWNGASFDFPPANSPTSVRIGKAFYPHVEVLQEFISARTVHNTTFVQADEPLGLATLYAGAKAQFAGQANAGFLAAHARELRPRLLSPLVNEVYRAPRTFTSTHSPANWFRIVPGASPYRADATTVRWVPVPGVSYALVRLHVKTWVVAGAAVPVGFRCYIVNEDNTFGAFVSAKLNIDHGVGGVGQWVSLGVLMLPSTATVRLALAHVIDPSGVSGNDANARYQINAWQVRPVFGEYP